jgi:hypothetical protein
VIEHFDAERICVPHMRRLLEPEQETPAHEVGVRPTSFADRIGQPAERARWDAAEHRVKERYHTTTNVTPSAPVAL